MTGLLELAETLERAADLLAAPGAWTQNTYARRSDGTKTTIQADDATCFCLAGGIARVLGEDTVTDMSRTYEIRKVAIVPLVGKQVATWNDARGRTQSEVVAMLRKAALRARATASESSPT